MSTLKDFGIPGISNTIMHPKHKHRWRARFVNLGESNDTRPLSAQLVRFTRPKLGYAKVEMHRFNSSAFVAGKRTIEPIDFTLEDDIANSAARILQEQNEKQQFITGGEGAFLGAQAEGSQYKFGVYLEMLDGGRKGDDTGVIERITFEGCWLENIDLGDVDYSSSDAIEVTVTMSFDHFRIDYPKYPDSGEALGGHA